MSIDGLEGKVDGMRVGLREDGAGDDGFPSTFPPPSSSFSPPSLPLPTRHGSSLFSPPPPSPLSSPFLTLVHKEVSTERAAAAAAMRRSAIRETEEKLNGMRRGHAEELQRAVTGTVTQMGGSLGEQEARQVKQLREALERKRDAMVEGKRVELYDQLELGLRALEKGRDGEIQAQRREAEEEAKAEGEREAEREEAEMREELAREELRRTVEARAKEIKTSNRAEAARVFGELATALEAGADRSLKELREAKEGERRAKEDHLCAHSEKVVGEAMERLAGSLLDGERSSLSSIAAEGGADRVSLSNKTRLAGTEAVARAVEKERGGIRERREGEVEGLRRELRERAGEELRVSGRVLSPGESCLHLFFFFFPFFSSFLLFFFSSFLLFF